MLVRSPGGGITKLHVCVHVLCMISLWPTADKSDFEAFSRQLLFEAKIVKGIEKLAATIELQSHKFNCLSALYMYFKIMLH